MRYVNLYQLAGSLARVSEEEWTEFEQSFQEGTASKGEILLKPGEEPRHIWIVTKGIMRNFFHDEKGKEYTKLFRGPGELIGPYTELLSRTPSRFTIQSVAPTTFVKFPYSAFEAMMDKHKSWERLGRFVAQNNFLEKERREFQFMHQTADQRYEDFVSQYGEFLEQIPQYQVASFLAVSPEALNRMLKSKKTK